MSPAKATTIISPTAPDDGGSLGGFVFGLLLAIAGVALILANERGAVSRYRALLERGGAVTAIEEVDPANDGRMVHVSGIATTEEMLKDTGFGISVNALALQRVVEMYQWREQRRTDVAAAADSYLRQWSDKLIHTYRFRQPVGHTNPPRMPLSPRTVQARRVVLGGFRLPVEISGRIAAHQDLPAAEIAGRRKLGRLRCRPHGPWLYCGSDPAHPQVGDVRIRFRQVPATEVTVVARQQGDRLVPHKAADGRRIDRVFLGRQAIEQVAAPRFGRDFWKAWGLRLAGWLLVLAGAVQALRQLPTMDTRRPAVLLTASAVAPAAAGAGWVTVRPGVGLALLAAGGLAAAAGVVWFRRQRSAAADLRPVVETRAPVDSATPGPIPAEPPRDVDRKPATKPSPGLAAPATVKAAPPEKPKAAVDPAAHGSPSPTDWMRAGKQRWAAGDFAGAAAAFTRAIDNRQGGAGAHYNRGVAAIKCGRSSQGLADLKTAAGMGHPKARQLLTAKKIKWP